jgi:hypothetical protein
LWISPVGQGARERQKEGVHNMHTLGFGSGRSGAGLGRIAEVSGGAADHGTGLPVPGAVKTPFS